MNTSKQVNVMIGLLFISFLAFGAYIANENNRAEAAREAQDDLKAHRGATIFVNNCRNCHGLEGKGSEEGGIAPPLNRPSFRIIGKDEAYPATPEGEAGTLRSFLFNTIACGRTNTAMPTWSERHGGPLSDTQINYLVLLITEGRWDLVTEIGEEHDHATTPPTTREDILVKDPASLSLTAKNCGQFNPLSAKEFYERDPFQTGGGATPGGAPTAQPAGPSVQGVPVADFFLKTCATCHGNKRQGLVGPALTPDRLTNTDDFYFNTIKNGRPGTAMPAWGAAGLKDDDIKTLVTFIKTVQP